MFRLLAERFWGKVKRTDVTDVLQWTICGNWRLLDKSDGPAVYTTKTLGEDKDHISESTPLYRIYLLVGVPFGYSKFLVSKFLQKRKTNYRKLTFYDSTWNRDGRENVFVQDARYSTGSFVYEIGRTVDSRTIFFVLGVTYRGKTLLRSECVPTPLVPHKSNCRLTLDPRVVSRVCTDRSRVFDPPKHSVSLTRLRSCSGFWLT